MRTINKGDAPSPHWSETLYKQALVRQTGLFCAYCESGLRVNQPIDIEHKIPYQNQDDPLRTAWHNLILSCRSCNSVKVGFDQSLTYLWADVLSDNTGCNIKVTTSGLHAVSEQCPVQQQEAARHTIDLFKFDQPPGSGHERKNMTMMFQAGARYGRWFRKFVNDARPEQEKLSDHLQEIAEVGYLSLWIEIMRTSYPELAHLVPQVVAIFSGTYSVAGFVVGT